MEEMHETDKSARLEPARKIVTIEGEKLTQPFSYEGKIKVFSSIPRYDAAIIIIRFAYRYKKLLRAWKKHEQSIIDHCGPISVRECFSRQKRKSERKKKDR